MNYAAAAAVNIDIAAGDDFGAGIDIAVDDDGAFIRDFFTAAYRAVDDFVGQGRFFCRFLFGNNFQF